MKVYTGIQLRLYRAFTSEYRKLYKLNRIYLDPQKYFTVLGTSNYQQVYQTDFLDDPNRITPEADPSMGSRAERLQRASSVLEMAKGFPGFNIPYVINWVLKEMDVPAPTQVYDGQPPPTPPEIQLKAANIHRQTIEGQTRMHAQLIEAISRVKLQEAQATLALAQAQRLGNQTAIDAAQTQLKSFSEIHSAMMELQRVVNESAETQSNMELAQQQQQQQQAAAAQSQGQPGGGP